MSDNFRVVEYLSTPSDLFCIYDYTKLAYVTSHYICIRELINQDIPPTFIKLNSTHTKKHSRVIGLLAFPNLLVLAERTLTRDVFLHFYSQHEDYQFKVFSEFAKRTEN